MMKQMKLLAVLLLYFLILAACSTNNESPMESSEHSRSLYETVANQESQLGLFIPSFVEEVNSIDDLNRYKDLFNAEIKVVGQDSELVHLTEQVLDDYDLEYRLIQASEQIVLEELDNYVIDHQRPILVALWKSHIATDNMNLKQLEDPKNVYGNSESVAFIRNKK